MNPMAGIPVGTVREENLLVTGEVAISFMGDESARVLSTPHLIGFLEMTARNLIKELIEPGYDSGRNDRARGASGGPRPSG